MISFPRTAVARAVRRPVVSGYKTLLLASALLFVGACSDSTPADPVVVGSIEVTPRLTTARVGATQQLAAAAKGIDGGAMAGETFEWTSSEPSVATVSSSGLVTFVGSGSTAILAKSRGTSGFATVVSEANVATVTITASSLTLPLGQTRQISATPLDASGVALFRPVTWTSSAPSVATISSTGLIVSVSGGTTTITAASEGKSASVQFVILPPAPVNTVTLSPNSGFVPTGTGVPLAITLRDVDNGILSNRVVVWASDNGAVSAAGLVTAATVGPVNVTATSEGKVGTATFSALTGVRSGAAALTVANTLQSDNPFVAYKEFAIYVPVGSTSLAVVMSGGTGDPDLYLFAPGNLNLDGTWVCRSWNGGPGENCSVTNPAAGVWRIIVDSYNAHSGTQLSATVTPTPP